MLQNLIPPRGRIILYSVYGYIGIAVGAVQTAYLAIAEQPVWLTITVAVYLFLGKPIGQLAGDNVDLSGTVVPTNGKVPAGYVATDSGIVRKTNA